MPESCQRCSCVPTDTFRNRGIHGPGELLWDLRLRCVITKRERTRGFMQLFFAGNLKKITVTGSKRQALKSNVRAILCRADPKGQ
jgi:hypothetical protein